MCRQNLIGCVYHLVNIIALYQFHINQPNKHNPFNTTMSFSRRLSSSLSPSIPKFPPFLPNPTFLPCFHSQPSSIDNIVVDAVCQFNSMLLVRDTPPIMEFNKIVGSLVKMKHYPTAISLFKQMQVKGIEPDLFTLNILINCFCHLQ